MAVHCIKCQEQYIEQIRVGKKTIEGRVDEPKWKDIKEGDRLEIVGFVDPTVKVVCEVLRRTHYESFEDMLNQETVEACLPGFEGDAIALYRSFPNYAEKEKMYGALALQVKPVHE